MPGPLRSIIGERLDEIAANEHLTRAQRWQRDKAWATALSIIEGTARPASWERLRSEHAAAVARLRKKPAAS